MNNPLHSPENHPWLSVLIAGTHRHWRIIVLSTVVLAIFAASYAYLSPQVYRAQVVLIPTPDEDDLSALSGLGGLASIVGGGQGSGRKNEALAILRSRAFTVAFMEKLNLRPVIFGSAWNATTQQWSKGEEPTTNEAYKVFHEDIRKIEENLTEGTVTIAIEWTNREQAAAWANALAIELNQGMQSRAIEASNRSLAYLQAELTKTNEIGVREGIFNLIEENIRAIAMANVQVEYAFSVVDRAAAPDDQDIFRPKKLAIIILGAVVGLITGLLISMSLLIFGAEKPKEDLGT
jgi:uncharacterized protein involved in exopolysaccharide biosynthesis